MGNDTAPETPETINIIVGPIRILEVGDRDVSARYVLGDVTVNVPRTPRPGRPPTSIGHLNAIILSPAEILYDVTFNDGTKQMTHEQLQRANPNKEFIITVQEPGKPDIVGKTNETIASVRERLFGGVLEKINTQREVLNNWRQWLTLSDDTRITFDLPSYDTSSKPESLQWLQVKFITIGNILKIERNSGATHDIGNVKEVRWAKIEYMKKRKDGPGSDIIRLEIQFNEGQPKQHCEIWLKEDGTVTVTETTHL